MEKGKKEKYLYVEKCEELVEKVVEDMFLVSDLFVMGGIMCVVDKDKNGSVY